jgi:hypothetical protein
MRRWVIAALAVAACGPGAVDGTVKGGRIQVKDAVHLIPPTGPITGQVSIGLSNQSGVCALLKQRVEGDQGLTIVLRAKSGPVIPGEYVVQSDADARAGIAATSNLFANTFFHGTTPDSTMVSAASTGGAVKVDVLEAARIAGNFQLEYGAEKVTGFFSTGACQL